MAAKRKDRGEDVDVRRSSSSSSKAARYEKSDRESSRNAKHSTRQDCEDRRSAKRPVAEAVREEVRPVREAASEEKILVVDKAEDCGAEGNAEASGAQTEGISAQQVDKPENEPEEVSAEKNQDADAAKELVPEAEIAEKDLGVPHTPDVEDVKDSCRAVEDFERLETLGEGAYGVVYKARDKSSGEVVALKKIKLHKETEGFPVTSLREINLLISLRHPCIVDVREVVIGSSLDKVYMVMEYIEHSLQARLKKQAFEHGQIKHMMLQLLDAVAYLHDHWVLHRDLKPSNILLTGKGDLKICDFGLARRYDSPIKVYTHNVVTRWYRAPELLNTREEDMYKYTTAIDVWSLGCIMGELIINEPLFPGESDIDQLRKINRLFVVPKRYQRPGLIFPDYKLSPLRDRILYPAAQAGKPMLSEKGLDLLARLLEYEPEKRITAKEALSHPWFEELPLPTPEGIYSSGLQDD